MRKQLLFVSEMEEPYDEMILTRMKAENIWQIISTHKISDITAQRVQGCLCVVNADVFLSEASSVWRALKIKNNLILIAYSNEIQDEMLCIQNGADDFVYMQDSYQYLINRISARVQFLDAHSDPSNVNERYIAGFYNWTFDLETMHLFFNKEYVHLTRKEQNLLRVFLTNDFEILSREKLHTLLYGATNEESELRRIDLLVSRLKKRLVQYNDSYQYIQSIRHKGYIFTSPVMKHTLKDKKVLKSAVIS